MYGNPTYMRIRDPTYRRGSEVERRNEVNKTFLARDEVIHVGSKKGSLQGDKESRLSVSRSLPCFIDR